MGSYHAHRMPLDPRSPLHRFRVDARASQRDEVERLQALGVVLTEIPPARAREILARFVREFVDPARGDQLEEELGRAQRAERAFDFERWLRPECVRHRGGAPGCVRWLASRARGARCVRFERSTHLPALAIDLATLEDEWAASWPGVFVSFEAARAVVVTVDYEELRCDVRASRGAPYR
jgi:hypothetical protein